MHSRIINPSNYQPVYSRQSIPVDTSYLEAARFIFDTLRAIRLRLIPRHLTAALDDNGAPEDAPSHELTMPQFNALVAVRDRGQVTIKELALAQGVSASSASTMVDRLVEMLMVTRRQSDADRREVVVRLTPEGEQAICALESVFLHGIGELLERLGPEYAEKWVDVYARIREILDDDAEPAGAEPTPRTDERERR